MGLLRTEPTDALQYALSFQGRNRKQPPVPWTNSTTMDDCAAFQSFVLWGPTYGGIGPITWVDNFKTSPDGTYHGGKAGMAPGDVVLFDWEGNGVGNHVEMCLTRPGSTGQFTTVGANGSDTIAVKVRVRNAYVLGYFRPSWGTTGDDDMSAADVAEIRATLANIESILAKDNGGGIRAVVGSTRATLTNVENIIARDNGGGIRGVVNSTLAKVNGLNTSAPLGDIDDADLKAIATAVSDEADRRNKARANTEVK